MENPAIPEQYAQNQDLAVWQTYQVQDVSHDEVAVAALKEIKIRLDAFEKFRTSITGPINGVLRDFNAKCKRVTEPMEAIDKHLRGQISKFRTARQAEVEAQARAQREKDLAEERALLSKATDAALSADSDLVDLEIQQRSRNVEKLETAPIVAKQTVRAGNTTSGTTERWIWEVEDMTKVPTGYLCVDAQLVDAVAKTYKKNPIAIPGIKFTAVLRPVIS